MVDPNKINAGKVRTAKGLIEYVDITHLSDASRKLLLGCVVGLEKVLKELDEDQPQVETKVIQVASHITTETHARIMGGDLHN